VNLGLISTIKGWDGLGVGIGDKIEFMLPEFGSNRPRVIRVAMRAQLSAMLKASRFSLVLAVMLNSVLVPEIITIPIRVIRIRRARVKARIMPLLWEEGEKSLKEAFMVFGKERLRLFKIMRSPALQSKRKTYLDWIGYQK
jgi:hypothetical protein